MKVFILRGVRYVFFLALLVSTSCRKIDSELLSNEGKRDLAQILAKGKITVVTDYTSTNYFLYKGEPMGYQFEMLRNLAAHLGVKLELITENNLDKSFEMLEKREVDIIANNLTVTASRKVRFSFTNPHGQPRQVLVQRKPKLIEFSQKSSMIRNPIDLADRIVYVQKGSASTERLKNLAEETGVKIITVEMPNYEAEQLIELVANGEIDYTVTDENIARVQSALYDNIDYETPVSFPQNLAWAIHPDAPDLLAKVNDWLASFTKTAEYRVIKNRYFDNPALARMMQSDYFYVHSGRISMYDDQLKSVSEDLKWDWRLLASLIYQESKFRHDAKSPSGAYGLMQFMPQTAKHFGIDHEANADVQLETGVRYLKWLEDRMDDNKIPHEEKIKFVLAAYNAGIGHVIDARNLARKYGRDPNVWENNVDYFIQNKSEFYRDTVVRFGYLRGDETYRYVYEILDRYEHYRNIVKE